MKKNTLYMQVYTITVTAEPFSVDSIPNLLQGVWSHRKAKQRPGLGGKWECPAQNKPQGWNRVANKVSTATMCW